MPFNLRVSYIARCVHGFEFVAQSPAAVGAVAGDHDNASHGVSVVVLVVVCM